MDRIDTKDEQGNPTYEVVNGKRMFRNGDPNSPEEVKATWLSAKWYNAIQEEVCGFVESQGMSLDAEDYNQLTEAIKKAAYYPYDFVCNESGDLQQILKENSNRDNLSVRVDSDQDITEPVVFSGKNLCIAGSKWGLNIHNKIPDQEYQGSFISISNDGFKISDLRISKFKHIVTFSRREGSKLLISNLNNCILLTNHNGDLHDGEDNILVSSLVALSSISINFPLVLREEL